MDGRTKGQTHRRRTISDQKISLEPSAQMSLKLSIVSQQRTCTADVVRKLTIHANKQYVLNNTL